MFNFKRFLDFVVLQGKDGKKIYPNESMKKRMLSKYKMGKKWRNKRGDGAVDV